MRFATRSPSPLAGSTPRIEVPDSDPHPIRLHPWIALVLALLACGLGPSAEELAETLVAETEQIEPAALPTEPPSALPPTETASPPPTNTPTPTPDPRPRSLSDGFEADEGNWEGCRGCRWEDGAVHMGPYAPSLPPVEMIAWCIPCGEAEYFHLAVDARHFSGQTDRGYGLFFWGTDQGFTYYEISPLFLLTLAGEYDYATRRFELLNPNVDQILSGLIRPGQATNRIEVMVEPSTSSTGLADVRFRANDKTAFLLYNRVVEPGRVGFGVGFHSIEVAFDNFDFEPIEAE